MSKHKQSTSSALLPFSKSQKLIGVFLIFLLGLSLGILPQIIGKEKFAHIDSEKVFNAFLLTQEYQNRMNNLGESRKSILRNLELQIQGMESRQAAPDSLALLYQQYQLKKNRFQTDEEAEISQYNQQIGIQLKEYINEFCAEKGYHYLFSSGESGNLLGAAPDNEVTEELIAFVNKKYKGEG